MSSADHNGPGPADNHAAASNSAGTPASAHELHGHRHDHRHSHAHGHSHGHAGIHAGNHGHVHAPASFGKAFAIGILLNTAFVIIEAGYGFIANSMALLADAGHNLSDVAGLIIAWAASIMARKKPSERFTYGWRGATVLAAMFNALFLLIAIGAIAWEAIRRFTDPQPVASTTVMIVAGIGIVINTITALMFMRGQDDLNIRGAFLHMAADAAVSAGVVAGGLLILLTGWNLIDPVLSLIIVAVIFWSTWGLLRDSVAMSMAAVPAGIEPVKVRAWLQERPGVASVHDLHIWSMSTSESALTCHLVMPDGHPGDHFLHDTCETLKQTFGIDHSTLQIETDATVVCHLAPDDVV